MTTTEATPEWLTLRGGELRRGVIAETWLVLLDGSPNYRLFVTPAMGKFTCVVVQTNNGKRLDKGREYPTVNEALTGGLEELREVLGW
jgi:hypothetical protein